MAETRIGETSCNRLVGAVAIVTGGAGGIGRAICARLAAEGAGIAIVDRDSDAAEQTAAAMLDTGARAIAIGADIADERNARAAVAAAERQFGPTTILVNNAAAGRADGVPAVSRDDWDTDIEATLTTAFVCATAVLPGMTGRRKGAIVNVSSINAASFFGHEAYSAAKAGLESLTRSIAVRHGPSGVRCNAIALGSTRTPAWQSRLDRDPSVLDRLATVYPLGRVGHPRDAAAAVAFFASEDSAWITGVVLPIDGGLTAGSLTLAGLVKAEPNEADAP